MRTRNDCLTTVWISAEDATTKLGISAGVIQKQGIPWQESPEPYRIRYKLALDAGDLAQRYYRTECCFSQRSAVSKLGQTRSTSRQNRRG